MQYRIEKDSIGTKEVPVDAYYGVQSLRGYENFQITGQRLRPEFICSLAEIKKACAICNHAVGELVEGSVGVITAICLQLGYAESADIAKTAIKTGQSVREVLKSREVLSEEEIEKLLDPETMV